MKRLILLPLLTLAFACSCDTNQDIASGAGDGTTQPDIDVTDPVGNPNSLVLATFNIRYINADDTGNKSWTSRRQYCVKSIRDNNFDIVGFQEVRYEQQVHLRSDLDEFEFEFVGRDDGTNGEAVGIGYNKSRLAMLSKGRFWLSPTPDQPSDAQAWEADTKRKRVAVWAKFKDLKTDKQFYFLSTHLEVGGANAKVRYNSAQLINEMESNINTEGLPFFVVGDMNSAFTSIEMRKIKEKFTDVFDQAEAEGLREGPLSTYNAFDTEAELTNSGRRVDYIYAKGTYTLLRYKVFDEMFNDQYPSDHLPVTATIVL